MRRTLFYVLFALAQINIWASDYTGRRLDMDTNHSNGDGLEFLMLLALVGVIIYVAYQVIVNAAKRTKQEKKIEYGSPEYWEALEKQQEMKWKMWERQREKEKKEEKGLKWGCLIVILYWGTMFVLSVL